jgi:hypothetical protein
MGGSFGYLTEKKYTKVIGWTIFLFSLRMEKSPGNQDRGNRRDDSNNCVTQPGRDNVDGSEYLFKYGLDCPIPCKCRDKPECPVIRAAIIVYHLLSETFYSL